MRQEVIIYICSERCRLTICGALHWVRNNSGNLISHHLKGDNFPVLPCGTKSSWLFICCYHVLPLEQHLYHSQSLGLCMNFPCMFNIIHCTWREKWRSSAHPSGKWPWKFIQSSWLLKDTTGDREQMLHFSRLCSVLAAHGWKFGQFAVYQSPVSVRSIH